METQASPSTPSVKWSLLFFAGVLILWQLLVPVMAVPSYLLPTPLAIAEEFQKRGGVMFGSDYPHPASTWPDSHQIIQEQWQGITSEIRQKIARDNARALFEIG